MSKYVLVTLYKDAWKTGEKTVVWVPHMTETDSSSQVISSVNELTVIDPLVTVVCSTVTAEYAEKMGFVNILIGSATTTKYYVNENSYIQIYARGTNNTRLTYFLDASTSLLDLIGSYGYSIQNYVAENENVIGYTWYQIVSDSRAEVINSYSETTDLRWIQFWEGAEIVEVDDDPYSDGGYSGEGGGTGTFSGTGDSIEFPGLPTLSAVSTGFITLFNPSIAQMQSLATYMWSDVFDIGLYKTLFADPMDCILGCSIVPVAVPNGGTKTVNVGNVSTGISMTVAASQYVEVDCGTLNVEEFWGSYLDYDPYTKAEIYLPYCGTHALQVDDIMGKAVHVKYHVDILSGACCAYVKCGSSVMYSFVGQCSSSIPISANDWTNVVNGALTIAASVGSLIATGGASAPMAVGAAAAVTGTIYGGGIKQNVEKSGSMGGTGGMLAVQTPYLILTRPRQALPKKQNTYTGYPSFITTKLSDLKGYTEIDSIRITGVPATDAELNELESILKSGVIF